MLIKKKLTLILALTCVIAEAIAQGPHHGGAKQDLDAYNKLKVDPLVIQKQQLPSRFNWVPQFKLTARNQGSYGTCVGQAIALARTLILVKQLGITDQSLINEYWFSPGFIYNQIKEKGDTACIEGGIIVEGLEVVRKKGVCFAKDLPDDCIDEIPPILFRNALPYKIDYGRVQFNFWNGRKITDQAIWRMKHILTLSPLIGGFIVPSSFLKNEGEFWIPEDDERPVRSEEDTTNDYHAMVIVGYDDEYSIPGKKKGAFLLFNSWGDWKDQGMCWVSYEDTKAWCFEVCYMKPQTVDLMDALAPSNQVTFMKRFLHENLMAYKNQSVHLKGTISVNLDKWEAAEDFPEPFQKIPGIGSSLKINNDHMNVTIGFLLKSLLLDLEIDPNYAYLKRIRIPFWNWGEEEVKKMFPTPLSDFSYLQPEDQTLIEATKGLMLGVPVWVNEGFLLTKKQYGTYLLEGNYGKAHIKYLISTSMRHLKSFEWEEEDLKIIVEYGDFKNSHKNTAFGIKHPQTIYVRVIYETEEMGVSVRNLRYR